MCERSYLSCSVSGITLVECMYRGVFVRGRGVPVS